MRRLLLMVTVVTLIYAAMGFGFKFFIPEDNGTDIRDFHKICEKDVTPYIRMNISDNKDREASGIIGAQEENITTILNDEDVPPQEGFYLMELEGLVVILTGDKNLYMCTDISMTSFPLNDRVRIHYGMYFPTLNELFSFLESYE